MTEKVELSKEKRIKKELAKLKRAFKDLDKNKKINAGKQDGKKPLF